MTVEQLTLGAVRASDPATSRAAARSLDLNYCEQLRGEIVSFLAALWRRSHDGATDDQLQSYVFFDADPGSVSKRRLEAVRLGLVRRLPAPDGEGWLRRQTAAGPKYTALVWAVTGKGLEAAWPWCDVDPVTTLATGPKVARNMVLDRIELACPFPNTCSEIFESSRARSRHLQLSHGASPAPTTGQSS